MCELGPPLRTFYKEDDRMAIHARNPSLDPHSDPSCMSPSFSTRARAHSAISSDFYNYFQHGIDFLISGTTHIVIKIVLHTNIVSSSRTITIIIFSPPARLPARSLERRSSSGTSGVPGRSRAAPRTTRTVRLFSRHAHASEAPRSPHPR